MNSFICLSILVCAVVAVSGDTCFKEDEFKQKMEEFKSKKFGPIAEECKEKNPDLDDAGVKECGKKRFHEAMKKCAQNNTDDKKKIWQCAAKDLGIEITEDDKNFDKYKACMLETAKDDRKKDVEDALNPCANDEHFHFCAIKNLVPICDDIKEMIEKFHKEHAKHQ